MPSDDFECHICRDSKHVLKDGIYKRCDCLTNQLLNVSLAEAGISYPSESLVLDSSEIEKQWPSFNLDQDTLSYLKTINSTILEKNIIPKKLFCFQGSADSPKDFMIQCILKSAVIKGMKVKSVTMPELVARNFKKDEEAPSLEKMFTELDILSVYFGSEVQYNIGASFLHELIRLHNNNNGNHCLILNTFAPLDLIGAKYGDRIKNLFVRWDGYLKEHDRRVFFMSVET